jgi:hypothetical protein
VQAEGLKPSDMLQLEAELKQARAALAAADARYKQDLARWQTDLDHERGKVGARCWVLAAGRL